MFLWCLDVGAWRFHLCLSVFICVYLCPSVVKNLFHARRPVLNFRRNSAAASAVNTTLHTASFSSTNPHAFGLLNWRFRAVSTNQLLGISGVMCSRRNAGRSIG